MSYIKKIFTSTQLKPLFNNFTHYSLFQLINYIVPLVTVPYIVRVVGLRNYGIISIAQAITYYFRIIVEYGFSISGVQYIAENQSDIEKKSEIYSNVIFIQTILMFMCFLLLLLLVLFIKDIRDNSNVFFLAYIMVPAYILLALWYYIGIEKIQYLNFINFLSKILYLVLIFSLLKNSDDFYFVPAFNSLSLTVAGLISAFILRYRFKIILKLPSILLVKKYLKEGFPLFMSNIFMNFYRNTNVIILSLFAPKETVGLYGAIERIIKTVQSAFIPITTVFYPYVSRIKIESKDRAISTVKKILRLMIIMGSILSLLVIIFSKVISEIIFTNSIIQAKILLQICSFVILFGVLNYVIGIIFMTNFGMKKDFTLNVGIIGILNLILCSLLSMFVKAYGTALSFILSEVLLFILILYKINSKKTWQIKDFFV